MQRIAYDAAIRKPDDQNERGESGAQARAKIQPHMRF
jgi:hypothetical protein